MHRTAEAVEEAGEGVAREVAGREGLARRRWFVLATGRRCASGWVTCDLIWWAKREACLSVWEHWGRWGKIWDSTQVVEQQRKIYFLRASLRHPPGAGTCNSDENVSGKLQAQAAEFVHLVELKNPWCESAGERIFGGHGRRGGPKGCPGFSVFGFVA